MNPRREAEVDGFPASALPCHDLLQVGATRHGDFTIMSCAQAFDRDE